MAAIAAADSVEGIQSLYEDLAALADDQLPNIERLCASLETHLDALKKLLDKTPKSDKSRDALASGIFSSRTGC